MKRPSGRSVAVPMKLAVGNHYGTKDYLPFFQADVSLIRYR